MTNKKENTEILAIVDLTQEYPGWTGEEQWAVITDCSASTIYNHPEVQKHQPCLFMTSEQWDAIVVSLKNDEKFRTRDRRKHDLFGYEACDKERYSSDFDNPVLDAVMQKEQLTNIREVLSKLSVTQRRRFELYYFSGLNAEEIAKEENVARQCINESIARSCKKIKNIFQKSPA